MQPKPNSLGPKYSAAFQDASVVAAYPTRPPYPAKTFDILVGLMASEPHNVLDVGCGTGDIARRLAALVARVDAVDVSSRMIALGKTLPGGDGPNLRWIEGTAEAAPIEPPYAMVTAAESLHWMDWPVVMPRLRDALVADGYLAMIERCEQSPWYDDLRPLFNHYSTNREFRPYTLSDELAHRGLFSTTGKRTTAGTPFDQSVDAYIESLHSRSSFSRERMRPEDVAAFDAHVRHVVAPYAQGDMLIYLVDATVVWGKPAPLARVVLP